MKKFLIIAVIGLILIVALFGNSEEDVPEGNINDFVFRY